MKPDPPSKGGGACTPDYHNILFLSKSVEMYRRKHCIMLMDYRQPTDSCLLLVKFAHPPLHLAFSFHFWYSLHGVDHHIYLMLRVATHCYIRYVHNNETLETNIWPGNKIYLFEPYQYKANTLAMHNSVQMVFRRSLAVSLGLVPPPAVQNTQIYGETNSVTVVESHDADTYVHIRAEQYGCFYYCDSS